MANYWLHNGFLQVEGEKMSKSLGNFVTINELLATDTFGGRRWSGDALRLAMLKTHYRQPIDWTVDSLADADSALLRWERAIRPLDPKESILGKGVVDALDDDLNTAAAITEMHRLDSVARSSTSAAYEAGCQLLSALELLGFVETASRAKGDLRPLEEGLDKAYSDLIKKRLAARAAARKAKDFAEADRIRDELDAMGIALKDSKDPATGELVTTWEVKR